MKSKTPSSVRRPGLTAALGGVLLAAGVLFTVQGAETNLPPQTTAQRPEIQIPQSIFVKGGRDPFYPEKDPVPLPADTVQTNGLPAAPRPYVLVLRGITGTSVRRVALINNTLFTEGERAEVPDRGIKKSVTCIRIGPNEAEVSVEGEPEHRTLKLREVGVSERER